MLSAKEIEQIIYSKKLADIEESLKKYGFASFQPHGLQEKGLASLIKELNDHGFIVERYKKDPGETRSFFDDEFTVGTVPRCSSLETEVVFGTEPDLIRGI